MYSTISNSKIVEGELDTSDVRIKYVYARVNHMLNVLLLELGFPHQILFSVRRRSIRLPNKLSKGMYWKTKWQLY